jgi:WD40 repeat protein
LQLHHVSLGLVYPHSKKIVHGDLKAVNLKYLLIIFTYLMGISQLNVLIDGGGKAVLCDFGLSRIKADATSRTVATSDQGGLAGSRNWMAPELLLGQSLKKECDIYAFGMTLYEVSLFLSVANIAPGLTSCKIFTHEIPLGHIHHTDFIELVVRQGVRPERPDGEDAPQLSNPIWELAEQCWAKNPISRPTASAISDILSRLIETNDTARPTLDSSPHQIALSPSSGEAVPSELQTSLPNLLGLFDTTSMARLVSDSFPSHSIPPAEPPLQMPIPAQAGPPHYLTPSPNLTLRGHTKLVYCAAFSPDGKYIVSGSGDKTVMVWDAKMGKCALGPLNMHTLSVWCVAFSPNGRRIASGSCDKTIVVWDAVTGEVVAGPLEGHTKAIWCVCFSPDDKHIASGALDNTVRIWDAQTGGLLVGPLTGHTSCVCSVVFSGDGGKVASGSDDRTVMTWDVRSGKLVLGPLRGHKNRVIFVAFSPDGNKIVSTSSDNNSCVWDTRSGVLVSGPSKRHAEGTLAVEFMPNTAWHCAVSPDGKLIAGIMNRNPARARLWDSKTGRLAATFAGHTAKIWTIAFAPDSKRVVSSSGDKTVRVYTLAL